jgi:hypothetical protein
LKELSDKIKNLADESNDERIVKQYADGENHDITVKRLLANASKDLAVVMSHVADRRAKFAEMDKEHGTLIMHAGTTPGQVYDSKKEYTVVTKTSPKSIMEEFANDNTKLTVEDIVRILNTYEDSWDYVMDKSYGEVSVDGIPFTRNRDKLVVSESGEFWRQILRSRTELNSLKSGVEKSLKNDRKSMTKVQKELLQKVTSISRAEIAIMAQEADQAYVSNYEKARGAGETFEQNITKEQMAEIEAKNQAYLKENPELMVEEGNMFYWEDGKITLDKDATPTFANWEEAVRTSIWPAAP